MSAMYGGRRLTTEEARLHEAWLDKLQESGAAYEAMRSANINLRDAMEAAQLASHNFHSVLRVNERRCGGLDVSREFEGERLQVEA